MQLQLHEPLRGRVTACGGFRPAHTAADPPGDRPAAKLQYWRTSMAAKKKAAKKKATRKTAKKGGARKKTARKAAKKRK